MGSNVTVVNPVNQSELAVGALASSFAPPYTTGTTSSVYMITCSLGNRKILQVGKAKMKNISVCQEHAAEIMLPFAN
jgi:hypothetical protein